MSGFNDYCAHCLLGGFFKAGDSAEILADCQYQQSTVCLASDTTFIHLFYFVLLSFFLSFLDMNF